MTGTIGTPSRRRGLVLLWLATLAACITTIATVVPGARLARASADHHLNDYLAVVRSAEDLARLRREGHSLPAQAGLEDVAEPKLATTVSGTLAAAGLPASTLASLSPESESTEWLDTPTPAADRGERSALLRRRATLVLTPLTLPQLGRFLSAWHDRAPAWTPLRIEVEPRGEKDIQPGTDLPLRVSLAVEAVSLRSTRNARP